jgi:hypothetical protein
MTSEKGTHNRGVTRTERPPHYDSYVDMLDDGVWYILERNYVDHSRPMHMRSIVCTIPSLPMYRTTVAAADDDDDHHHHQDLVNAVNDMMPCSLANHEVITIPYSFCSAWSCCLYRAL